MKKYIKYGDKYLTVRKYLKMLKKEFKQMGLLDRRIEETSFRDTALLWLEDDEGLHGNTCITYGINEVNTVIVRRR